MPGLGDKSESLGKDCLDGETHHKQVSTEVQAFVQQILLSPDDVLKAIDLLPALQKTCDLGRGPTQGDQQCERWSTQYALLGKSRSLYQDAVH